ncbi:2-succinyl-5-enolpyruvyl-6-hydroxy-3-cyclohexene-1-carboxylic-acid synthase [Demequina sp.]|uniref:2-succinyl-5-enolpyruvyl-6-hydroxy-3- cyclohexene-1-carboxylic-acid synthase n=1 Tax=Demequina sp. TaxID=2050685 RepID=UPI003D10EF6D
MTHPAASFARELVASLAVHGVEDFVLCPGSRSGPVAHALVAAASGSEGAPKVSLHVRIDERSAAFLALGIARGLAAVGTPRPVAVVTTSGTAVGNLLPAVMEAHHSGVPLIVITADRPRELRGVGANQTTDQVGIFGTFVRWSADIAAPADAEPPGRATRLASRAAATATGDAASDEARAAAGPVHLNVEFREPLGPDGGAWPETARVEPVFSGVINVGLPAEIIGEPLPSVARGVVIAGDGAGDAARIVAEAHGWPLFAEPTSGARAGGNCVAGYVHALGTPEGRELAGSVEQVVVIGRPTLTRGVQSLIASAPALYVAAHGARWREAPLHATQVLPRVPRAWLDRPDVTPDQGWLNAWLEIASGIPVTEGWNAKAVAETWLASLGPESLAVVGSSGPIRAIDRVAPAWPVGRAPQLLANRGLSGIDGTVSTAVGVALGARGPVEALMGDVTFLHDVGGLLVGPLEARPDVRIVVVNDGGGTIFGGLEHSAAPSDHVERVFTTPHGVAIGPLCAAYGAGYSLVSSVAELGLALRRAPRGVEVVEAVVA